MGVSVGRCTRSWRREEGKLTGKDVDCGRDRGLCQSLRRRRSEWNGTDGRGKGEGYCQALTRSNLDQQVEERSLWGWGEAKGWLQTWMGVECQALQCPYYYYNNSGPGNRITHGHYAPLHHYCIFCAYAVSSPFHESSWGYCDAYSTRPGREKVTVGTEAA